MVERLIGFVARVPEWPPVGYLKRDVSRAWSVDTMIWPAWFPVEPVHPANWRRGEWDDLQALLEQEVAGAIIVAISVCLDDNEQFGIRTSDGTFYDNTNALPMARLEQAWIRVGFDVADGSMLSGLTNCGNGWGDEFGPYLNELHLFDDLGHAQAFRDLANVSVREHAPFYVFAIYLVRGDGSTGVAARGVVE